MSGMGTGLNTNNPTIVSAFHRALLHQGLVVLAIVFLVALAWNLLRSAQLRAAAGKSGWGREAPRFVYPEAPARRLLRVSFGLLWIFDGILQGQASMPLGMGPQVIQPAAAASPTWVQHVDNSMATIWSYHPIAAPAATVWIQIGIGLWLLAAPRGNWSRLGGVASVGWGLIVWIFGEAFGQIFAPGLTWLFGAPGAVLFYCVAGALIALPERLWETPLLGRLILRVTGVFFVGMAVLQAWPGRGFWQGQSNPHAAAGSLTTMVQQMAQTPQPHLLSSWAAAFAGFDAAHGWAVNLFAVMALGAIGAAFLTARPRIVRAGGGGRGGALPGRLGADRGSGVHGRRGHRPQQHDPHGPDLRRRLPGHHPDTRPEPDRVPDCQSDRRRKFAVGARPGPAHLRIAVDRRPGRHRDHPGGRHPHGLGGDQSQRRRHPHPSRQRPSPSGKFTGTGLSAHRPVRPAHLPGRAWKARPSPSPCSTTCAPPTARSSPRSSAKPSGSSARRPSTSSWWPSTATPDSSRPTTCSAFDQQEQLTSLPNWRYLTGSSLAQLQQVWRAYGMQAEYLPGGAMIDHSEFADIIDGSGHLRYVVNTDPGPATQATQVVLLGGAGRHHQKGARQPMSGRRIPRRRLVVALAAALGAMALGACASTRSTSTAPTPSAAFPTPLATSIATSQGTWATVAMGHLERSQQHLLAAVLPPGRIHSLVEPGTGHRHGHQRRLGAGRWKRSAAGGGDPPVAESAFHPSDRHRRRRPVVDQRTARRRAGGQPDRSGCLPGRRDAGHRGRQSTGKAK